MKPQPRRHAWVKTGVANIYVRGTAYYYVKMSNGKRVFTALRDATGKPVADLADAIRAAAAHATNPFVGRCELVGDLLPEFYGEKMATGDWQATTKDGHRHIYEKFAAAHPVALSSLTTAQLQAWYDGLLTRVSPGSALTYWACIASFFRWAYERHPRKIQHNPAAAVVVKNPEPSRDRAFADYALRDRLLATATDDNLRVFLYLGFHFGLRRREIDHARPEWINLDQRLLTVRNLLNPTAPLRYFRIKNGKERRIPMSKAATEFFTTYLAGLPPDAPYLLAPRKIEQGKNRYRYDMRRPFENHLHDHGAEWLTIQGMRVTFASLLASTGKVNILQIADWLGDTIKTTEHSYAHLIPQHDLIEAAFGDR